MNYEDPEDEGNETGQSHYAWLCSVGAAQKHPLRGQAGHGGAEIQPMFC